MYTCEFCHSTFATKGNLSNHQRTAKFCLSKQGVQSARDTVCEFCQTQYSTVYRLRQHTAVCSVKKHLEEKEKHHDDDRYQHVVDMYELKLQMLERENIALKEQLVQRIDAKDAEIALLREQLEKRIEDITDMARQAKSNDTNHITINNNTMTALDLRNTDSIHSMLNTHLDINVLADGQRGLARMIYNHFLTDEHGNKRYKCTDTNRGHFAYVDPSGVMERDPKAIKLRNALVDSNLKEVAYNRGEEYWKRDDGSVDLSRFNAVSDKVQEVALLQNDDSKFRGELSVLAS